MITFSQRQSPLLRGGVTPSPCIVMGVGDNDCVSPNPRRLDSDEQQNPSAATPMTNSASWVVVRRKTGRQREGGVNATRQYPYQSQIFHTAGNTFGDGRGGSRSRRRRARRDRTSRSATDVGKCEGQGALIDGRPARRWLNAPPSVWRKH